MSEVHLFDMESVAMDSPRLTVIKALDIQTHYSATMEEDPWLAIPMKEARERLKGSITEDEPFETVADIMASYCRLLDDCGLLFYGDTEEEAQDAAIAAMEARRNEGLKVRVEKTLKDFEECALHALSEDEFEEFGLGLQLFYAEEVVGVERVELEADEIECFSGGTLVTVELSGGEKVGFDGACTVKDVWQVMHAEIAKQEVRKRQAAAILEQQKTEPLNVI